MRCEQRSGVANLVAAALAIGSLLTPTPVLGQSYPSKAVHILVALSPGSGTDLITRLLAAKMSESWAQPVIVENRPGAAGSVAAAALVNAPADGHTLMAYSDGHVVSAALNASKLPYDTLRDIARVSMIARFPSVLVVSPSLGVNSVQELIALAKAKPGQLSFGSAGVGGGLHLSGEMFKVGAGIDVVHVPYKGPLEALGDTMSGRIHYMFSSLGPTLPHIKSGKVRALAVSSSERSALLPELPTLAEAAMPDFVYELWAGWFAPAKTPPAVLQQISREVARIMTLTEMREQLLKQGMIYRPNTPEEFDQFVRTEVERLSNVGKSAGIRLQ